MPRQAPYIEDVKIAEIRIGDKLLTQIIGYKDRVIYNNGHVFTPKDIAWFAEKLAEEKPQLASERYLVGRKSPGDVMAKNKVVLVKRGEVVTEEALQPLLKEGFVKQNGFDNEVMFVRPTDWGNKPYRIDQFNPVVRVETLRLVGDDGKLAKEPEKAGAGR